MAHQKNPWSKFYWADWRSDPRLRMCTLAARGLWMEILALMHEAEPYGHLLISANAPTNAQLSVLAGAPSDQIPELLRELESAGVFSRTSKGVIYSRRMVRDQKKARTAQKNGLAGGNPKLCNQREIPASDKGQDKGEDKTQKLEARSQIPEEDSEAIASAAAAADPKRWVFGELLSWLKANTGRSEDHLRSFLGKCCAKFGDDAVAGAGLMIRQPPVPVDPVSAMMERLTRGANHVSKSAAKRLSPISALYAGAALALADSERAGEFEQPHHHGAGNYPPQPLLDRR